MKIKSFGWCSSFGLFCALGLGLLSLQGCKEPMAVDSALELRAAATDSTHILVEFPEALDASAMNDTTNFRVEMSRRSPTGSRFLAVHRAAVVDSVHGRTIEIETAPFPDAVSLWVTTREIRLLTGQRLGAAAVTVVLTSGLSYYKDIAPLFAQQCNHCHSGSGASGQYVTDNYYSLYANGTDQTGNLLPGDANSELATKCLPTGSMYWKAKLGFLDALVIQRWILTYGARM